jgi:hypothetical protein
MLRSEILTINTTGSAGAATGSATSTRITGEIVGIDVNYHASAPATTDLTIQADAVGGGQAARNLHAKSNSVTAHYVSPGVLQTDNAGAALTGAQSRPYVVNGTITASLAQCNALAAAATVTIHYLR